MKTPNQINILIACEESQRTTLEFRKRGFRCFSADLQSCSGGHPEWHIKGDVLPLLNGNCEFFTIDKDGNGVSAHFVKKWDLIIAHPPCTYLTVTGNRWFNIEKYGDKAIQRYADRACAVDFFMQFVHAECDHIAIENPVGCMSSFYRKPDQIIQPYMFGDPFEKKTCLWLKGLPELIPTNEVEPPKRIAYASGKTMPAWYAEAWKLPKEECSRMRSKTFDGIAKAFATQWGEYLLKETNTNV